MHCNIYNTIDDLCLFFGIHDQRIWQWFSTGCRDIDITGKINK